MVTDWLRRRMAEYADSLHPGDKVTLPLDEFDVVESEGYRFRLSPQIADYKRVKDNPWFRNIRPGDVCLDVGACVGAITIPLAKMAARVVAVEPLFFEELAATVKLNHLTNVRIMPYGIGPTCGRQRVSFSGRDSFVDTLTFDEVFEQMNEPVDVLKVDIEGAEWQYLPGTAALLDIRELRLEFHLRRGSADADYRTVGLLAGELRSKGYDVIVEHGVLLSGVMPWVRCVSINASRIVDSNGEVVASVRKLNKRKPRRRADQAS